MCGRLKCRFLAYAMSCALLLLIGCGNDSNSGTSTGSNTGSTGGSPTTGGSNSGNTGSGGGSSGGTSSSAATYVYAGMATDTGGIRSFKLDISTGALTEITGSPTTLPQGFTTGGSLVALKGFVYTANRPGDFQPAALYTYKADATTGSLTPGGSPLTVSPQNDADVRKMKLAPGGNTAYLISQFNVNAVALNNGTPAKLNTQPMSNGDTWGFAVAGKFAYAGIQDGNPKSGFAQPVIKRMAVASDGSLGAPQVVVTLPDTNLAYDLAADDAGKFIAATTGLNNDHVSVWSVNASTGDLTAVPGSPFVASTNIGKFLQFDSAGTHLYLINNPEFEPRHEDVLVFTVSSDGALTPVQTLDLGNGQQATGFKVENDFAYITNVTDGAHSNITVLRRDSSSGQLSVANKAAVGSALGSVDTLHF